MNIKQRAISQQILDADTVRGNGHKSASFPTARVVKSATILKSTLDQTDIEMLNGQMAGKSSEQQEQILQAWYGWADRIAAIVAQNGNGHLAGNVWESLKRTETDQKRNNLVAKVSQPTIYELARAAVGKLDHNPTSPAMIFLTANKEVFLLADGLGAVSLVYRDRMNRVAVTCAEPIDGSLEWDWDWTLKRTEYQEWVRKCHLPPDRSALGNLQETRLGGLSPRAQKAMRRW